MKNHYDNSERLETVSDKQWRDALDELTAYLRWRLVISKHSLYFFRKDVCRHLQALWKFILLGRYCE